MDDLRPDQRRALIGMVKYAQRTFPSAKFSCIISLGQMSYKADPTGTVEFLVNLEPSDFRFMHERGYITLAYDREYYVQWTVAQKGFDAVAAYIRPRWKKAISSLLPATSGEWRQYLYPTVFATIGAAALIGIWNIWLHPLVKKLLSVE